VAGIEQLQKVEASPQGRILSPASLSMPAGRERTPPMGLPSSSDLVSFSRQKPIDQGLGLPVAKTSESTRAPWLSPHGQRRDDGLNGTITKRFPT